MPDYRVLFFNFVHGTMVKIKIESNYSAKKNEKAVKKDLTRF